MNETRHIDDFANGGSELRDEVRSFLQTSARYFGLPGVSDELVTRVVVAVPAQTGSGQATSKQHSCAQEHNS